MGLVAGVHLEVCLSVDLPSIANAISVIAFAMVLLLYRPPKSAIERGEHNSWHRIDFFGGFLSVRTPPRRRI